MRMAKDTLPRTKHDYRMLGGDALKQLPAISISPLLVDFSLVRTVKVTFYVFLIKWIIKTTGTGALGTIKPFPQSNIDAAASDIRLDKRMANYMSSLNGVFNFLIAI